MGTYPIKILRDENGHPFVPLTSLDAVVGEKNLQYIMNAEEVSAGHFKIKLSDVQLDKILDTAVIIRWPNINSTVKPSYLQLNDEEEKPLYNGNGTEYLSLEEASNTINILAFNGDKWILASGSGTDGGGHIIANEQGNTMEQQRVLQFVGFNIENDTAHRATKISNPQPINNLDTAESGIGSLDAYQGHVLAGRSIPAGGFTGQVLAKKNESDYQVEWVDRDSADVITSDGSVDSVVTLTYEEYANLENSGLINPKTQYNITDMNAEIEKPQTLVDFVYDGTPISLGRQETIVNDQGNLVRREMLLAAYEGVLVEGGGDTIVQLPQKALMRNVYGLVYYQKEGTFLPLNYSNPNVPIYTYFSLKNKTMTINSPAVFGGCEFIMYVEYVLLEEV